MAKKKKVELDRATWLRRTIIDNPGLTFENLVKKYDKQGLPTEERPTQQQFLQLRTHIAKRWGVESVDDLPRNPQGKINIAALVRRYLESAGTEANWAGFQEMLATDGIQANPATFYNAKSLHLQGKKPQPRARYVGKKGRKPGRRQKPVEVQENGDNRADFEAMERQLEGMMTRAEGKKSLHEALRHARRLVSAELV